MRELVILRAAKADRKRRQEEAVDRGVYEEFLMELRKNAMLSQEYKDHLIRLYLAGISDAFRRGKKSE